MQYLRIHNKVKELRLLHGFTQAELAGKINSSKWIVSLLERELSNPSKQTAENLSKTFSLPVNKIFYI